MNSSKTAAPARDFTQLNEMLTVFLQEKGYGAITFVGDSSRSTFTYKAQQDEMPYWIKLCVISDKNNKREADLRNEVAALTALWKLYPDGDAGSFFLPPGPEVIFDENYQDVHVYGYSRFEVEGKILATELREGREIFSSWVDIYAEILKTIDALPDLGLPRTEAKKQEKFEETIMKNGNYWLDVMKGNVPEEVYDCAKNELAIAMIFFEGQRVVMGTVHGDIVPDHVVFLNHDVKPTIVQFTKLCQWYPRFWDVGAVYGWVQAVLGDGESAWALWSKVTSNGFDKKQIDYLKIITNVNVLASMGAVISPEWGNGEMKARCGAFVK